MSRTMQLHMRRIGGRVFVMYSITFTRKGGGLSHREYVDLNEVVWA
jgi:hypothetical protein